MKVLEEGYVIPFTKPPPAYEGPNNASANQNMSFVYQYIAHLKEMGVISFVDRKPHCVSPLRVLTRIGNDGVIKKDCAGKEQDALTPASRSRRARSHIFKGHWKLHGSWISR